MAFFSFFFTLKWNGTSEGKVIYKILISKSISFSLFAAVFSKMMWNVNDENITRWRETSCCSPSLQLFFLIKLNGSLNSLISLIRLERIFFLFLLKKLNKNDDDYTHLWRNIVGGSWSEFFPSNLYSVSTHNKQTIVNCNIFEDSLPFVQLNSASFNVDITLFVWIFVTIFSVRVGLFFESQIASGCHMNRTNFFIIFLWDIFSLTFQHFRVQRESKRNP